MITIQTKEFKTFFQLSAGVKASALYPALDVVKMSVSEGVCTLTKTNMNSYVRHDFLITASECCLLLDDKLIRAFIAQSGSKNGKISNEGGGAGKDWGESIRQTHGQAGTSRINTTGANGIIADTTGIECNGNDKHNNGISGQEQGEFGRIHSKEFSTDTSHEGLQRCKEFRGVGSKWKKRNKQPSRCIPPTWQKFPTQPPICGGDDGLPTELDGITFPKWRSESIKAYGNAIVPQVVLQIFKAIEQYEAKGLSRIGHQ